MTQDLADHPFSPESVAYESGASDQSERAWFKWCATAERLLGHILDGDDPEAEGYSMDEAYEAWEKGATAHAYVALVTSRERYHGRRVMADRLTELRAQLAANDAEGSTDHELDGRIAYHEGARWCDHGGYEAGLSFEEQCDDTREWQEGFMAEADLSHANTIPAIRKVA